MKNPVNFKGIAAAILLLASVSGCSQRSESNMLQGQDDMALADRFEGMEYNLSFDTRGIPPGSGEAQIREYLRTKLPFLTLWPETAIYKMFFVDSRDRILNKGSLLVRLRSNLSNPRRSDIVLKSRNKSIDQVEEFDSSWFKSIKHEIDVVGEAKTYSISHELAYHHGKDLDPSKIRSGQEVLDLIGAKSPKAKDLLQDRLGSSELVFPGVVDRYKFEAVYKGQFTATVEVWDFDGKTYLGGMSFKGSTSEEGELEALNRELMGELEAAGMLSKETISKTQAYFLHFGLPDR